VKTKALVFSTVACAVAVHAGPRTSANYSVSADTADPGGARSASTSYTHDGSLGGVVGVSTVATPAETAKHGYLGQLYEVTGLAVNATPATVDETSSRQLSTWQELDDNSQIAISAASVAWSIVTGPLTDISTAGLATAGTVYENTPARVQGSYASLSGLFDLTVLNILPDNFGSYANDTLDDDWQVLHFGQDNTDAAPLKDPDGDGQNNHFEFVAGLIPTDPLSRFLLRVEPVAGEPTHKRLVFSPRFDDRNYDILTSTSLLGLSGGIVSDIGTERSVTDTNATEGKKFYRVGITKP
jgi:hypothetical protein